jgi:biotin carboxyl carrier protein
VERQEQDARMKRKFTVTVGAKEFQILKSDDGSISVDGKEIDYQLDFISDGQYTLWFGPVSYTISQRSSDAEEIQREICVNGRTIMLTVEDERDALLHKFQSSSATRLQSAAIKAPMPGKISKILVSEGELIEEGQGVLILEAMKMENEIKSPASGIVKKVHILELAAVEKNTLLLEIE